MASRRKARETALQMLFQWDVGGHPPEEVVSRFLPAQRLDPQAGEFARRLFEGTVEAVSSLDARVRDTSEHWRIERMAAVDRNVLRMALFELVHLPETPPAVVINEALEIVRRFSTEEGVEFVNGVLDAVRRSLAVKDSPPVSPSAGGGKPPVRRPRASRSKGGYGK